MTSRFDRDTEVRPIGDGVFEGRIDRGWWIERGPNGGYVAALVLRALTAAVDDPHRTPRSLTVHYLRPPAEGPVQMATTVERAGRSMSTVSGRLTQDGRLLALAVAAFGTSRPGPSFSDAAMPEVPPVDEATDRSGDDPMTVPMRERFEQRWAQGPLPFSGGGGDAVAGGWIRLVEPRPVDHLLLAMLSDAWVPAVFGRVSPDERFSVPTVDLTVHFRAPLPHAGLADDDFVLVSFATRVLADGFMEEDGEVWSPDGTLLAQSRQLAAVLPIPG